MAFGVSPKHVRDQIFSSLTYEEILITALEAAKKLNWKIGFTSQRAFIAYTKFSMSSWGEEVNVNIEHQKLIVKSECTGNQLIDWGKNKENVDAFLKAFQDTVGTLSPEEIAYRYQQLGTDISSPSVLLNQPLKTSRNKVQDFFSIFIPVKGYFVTPIILNLNIVVFGLMILSGVDIMVPDTESLISLGRKLPTDYTGRRVVAVADQLLPSYRDHSLIDESLCADVYRHSVGTPPWKDTIPGSVSAYWNSRQCQQFILARAYSECRRIGGDLWNVRRISSHAHDKSHRKIGASSHVDQHRYFRRV